MNLHRNQTNFVLAVADTNGANAAESFGKLGALTTTPITIQTYFKKTKYGRLAQWKVPLLWGCN